MVLVYGWQTLEIVLGCECGSVVWGDLEWHIAYGLIHPLRMFL